MDTVPMLGTDRLSARAIDSVMGLNLTYKEMEEVLGKI
jgi:hypothetical protein